MTETRSCTCNPDDDPPRPCPQKFAYHECMRAALRAAERDAARYRWLRDRGEGDGKVAFWWGKGVPGYSPKHGQYLDAAIDAARSAQEGERCQD